MVTWYMVIYLWLKNVSSPRIFVFSFFFFKKNMLAFYFSLKWLIEEIISERNLRLTFPNQ